MKIMKERANMDVRNLIEKNRIMYWEVARELGISEPTMTRWLRTELSHEKKEMIISAVNALIERED